MVLLQRGRLLGLEESVPLSCVRRFVLEGLQFDRSDQRFEHLGASLVNCMVISARRCYYPWCDCLSWSSRGAYRSIRRFRSTVSVAIDRSAVEVRGRGWT